MTETPPALYGWTELSPEPNMCDCDTCDSCDCEMRHTPSPFGSDSDLVAMLREAQDCMSARMSGCSSVLCPASPEPEPFPLNWDSLPTILPPPHWNLPASPPHLDTKLKPATYKENKGQEGAAARYEKIVFTLLITNIISLVLGAGIGICIHSKKNLIKQFFAEQ